MIEIIQPLRYCSQGGGDQGEVQQTWHRHPAPGCHALIEEDLIERNTKTSIFSDSNFETP